MARKFKSAPKAVDSGMDDAADAVKRDFEKTTQGWQHRVTFTITKDGPNRTITTDDDIWKMVDEGTPEHDIYPRHKRALAFSVGGRPKTRPGIIVSGSGSKGSVDVVRPHVHHPGTKARLFTKQIAKLWSRGTAPFIRDALEAHFR